MPEIYNMTLPLRGEAFEWPDSVGPGRSVFRGLEAATQEWHEFCNRSWDVKLYKLGCCMMPIVIVVSFGYLAGFIGAMFVFKMNLNNFSSKVWLAVVVCMGPGTGCAASHAMDLAAERIRNEAEMRLAMPLNRVLSGSGWAAQARFEGKDRHSHPPKPEMLPPANCAQCCCDYGFLFLEFTSEQSAEARLLSP